MNLKSGYLSIASLIVGAAIGLMGGSALMLIVWAVAGIVLGLWAQSVKTAILAGFLYGFFLLFCFMISGYVGTIPLVDRLPGFALIGLGGAVGGIGAQLIGFALKRVVHKKAGRK